LAFAEVFTVIEFMHGRNFAGRSGFGITNHLLETLQTGASMDASLNKAVGLTLGGMQKEWRQFLKRRPFRRIPGAKPRQLVFVKGDTQTAKVEEEEDEQAVADADGVQNRKWVRLGNLLRRRGRKKAATIEYEKAVGAGHQAKNASLLNRLIGLHMELEAFAKAGALLPQAIETFPNDPQTRILEGRLALREKRYAEALNAYDRAAWENPFHPEIYMAYYEIAEREKDDEKVTIVKEQMALLTGKVKSKSNNLLTRPKRFGTVNIDSSPWGMIYIDGRETGLTTPLVDYPLEPGAHIVRVTESIQGKTAHKDIEVVEGKSVRINLQLAK